MGLLTASQKRTLMSNGRWNKVRRKANEPTTNFQIVARLVCRSTGVEWLLSEIDPIRPNRAYALTLYPNGRFRTGWINLPSLQSSKRYAVEADHRFRSSMSLQCYVASARSAGPKRR